MHLSESIGALHLENSPEDYSLLVVRSSYHCRYFVLPCCPWDFAGKFSGQGAKGKGQQGHSQYGAYLEFVRDVGLQCGFQVVEDTLRIPSTRRVGCRWLALVLVWIFVILSCVIKSDAMYLLGPRSRDNLYNRALEV